MAGRFWVGGSGTWDASSTANWAATSGGASGASAPTTADTVTIDSNSGSGTITTASGATCSNLTINSANIGVTHGANFSQAGNLILTLGALDLAGFSHTCVVFSSSNSNVRSIAFGTTGKVVMTGNSATVFTTATNTNLTYTGTPVFEFSYAGATGTRTVLTGTYAEANAPSFNVTAGTDAFTGPATAKNLNFTGFAGTWNNSTRTLFGGLTISSGMTPAAGASTCSFGATSGTHTITTSGKTLDFPLSFNGAGGAWEFADALTQGSTRAFTISNGTVKLKNGVVNTVGAFATSGSTQKYLQSVVTGSQATLSQSSGTVSASYLTIQDINATGGATWNALYENQNVDAGGNTGWNFGGSPQTVSEVTYTLRSFTTPRRF